MRILLIDNHDSYTYNLYQLIADVTGAAPAVLVNDDPRLARLADGGFGAAVISPGPGRPQRTRDTGHLAGFLNRTSLPVLGVCLGHQAIAHAAGADVGPAPAARHGHLSTVQPCGNQPCGNQHRGNQHWRDPLLRGLPGTFTAVRYHSLCVRDPLPPVLEAIARAEDGVIMALRHRSLPRWGVQFHPESVATQFGRELLANFLALAGRPGAREPVRLAPPPTGREPAGPEPAGTELAGPEPAGTGLARTGPARTGARGAAGTWRLVGRALRVRADAEVLFTRLFGSSASGFWLDSAMPQPGLARFSFMGDASGPLSETLTYRTGEANVLVTDSDGIRAEPGTMFDVLERRLAERRLAGGPQAVADAGPGRGAAGSPGGGTGLPFGFTGGYVGYFGYEMKADCGASAAHRATTPDSVWIFADRLIAVDHETGVSYVIAVHDDSDEMRSAAREWVEATARRVTALAEPGAFPLPGGPGDVHGAGADRAAREPAWPGTWCATRTPTGGTSPSACASSGWARATRSA